jgi:hypothetical protein
MKKLLLGTMLFVMVIVFPVTTIAAVDIHIGFTLPPLIAFEAPPNVIVLPDTNDVYVVPDIAIDLFFWNGWWWRSLEGRWYRSLYYDRGWAYYNAVPSFYYNVDPGWRGHYRDHNWYGYRWDYERIPQQRLQQNWRNWQNNQYWERQRTWGVQSYQPRPQQQRSELRDQRQPQYQQRPDVQQHQPQIQSRQRQPQVMRPQVQQQRQPEIQRPQVMQERQPQVMRPQGRQLTQGKTQYKPSQGRPEERFAENRR